MNDPVVQAWGTERQAIMTSTQVDHSVGSDEWLRRFGEIDLSAVAGIPTPKIYAQPTQRCARPHEVRMDAANAMLIRAYPSLREAPVHFAMLEAVYGLDVREAVRFPTPKLYRDNPQLAQSQRHSVRTRSWDRIQRAIRIIEREDMERAAAQSVLR
jgi:hypothetical protein